MFGKVMMFVFRELRPALRMFLEGIRERDEEKRKRALVWLENEAEKLAMEKARGL